MCLVSTLLYQFALQLRFATKILVHFYIPPIYEITPVIKCMQTGRCKCKTMKEIKTKRKDTAKTVQYACTALTTVYYSIIDKYQQ